MKLNVRPNNSKRLSSLFMITVCLISMAAAGSGISIPGAARAQAWLVSVRMATPDLLTSGTPPPFPAQVLLGKQTLEWPAAKAECSLPSWKSMRNEEERLLVRSTIDSRKCLIIMVAITQGDQVLSRGIEMPPDSTLKLPSEAHSLEAYRQAYLTKLLQQRPCNLTAWYDTYFVDGVVRKMRGEPPVYDKARLEAALERIDKRIDCADFDLAFALRFYRLGAGTEEDRRRIKESALRFRYWRTEPGNDVMVYHGENHPLLYHSDQLIAGNLWPDEVFTNSGLEGREQATLGKQQCLDYLWKLESEGYEEFLSTTYIPVTTGALMNLVDFSDDPNISRRAARQLDKIYRMMAEHCFDGVMLGPQGRTSRRMLYPQVLPTQALLSYATARAAEAFDPWAIFVASSPSYRVPSDLQKLMDSQINRRYREAYFFINLDKTCHYMLSSIEISASPKDPSYERQRGAGERGYQWHASLVPGGKGYQQHVWDAVLARDCQVFTNHPGSTTDRGDGTPGFWTGNSTFPRQTQNGNVLMQIFSIPEDSPVQFTHAYWPSGSFDIQRLQGHWAFGGKKNGYIALWCSVRPKLVSDVLVKSELRAYGSEIAWVCICSSESESRDFDSFMRSCESMRPRFDPASLTLHVKGQEPMTWNDGQAGEQRPRL